MLYNSGLVILRLTKYDTYIDSHPVTNDYLPEQFKGEVFLRQEGDLTDKTWDEAALHKWEMEENGGVEWEGRRHVQEAMQRTEKQE